MWRERERLQVGPRVVGWEVGVEAEGLEGAGLRV